VGRLHKLTFSPQYKHTFLLVNYPDKKRRLKLKLYDFWFSKIANPLKYFSMHCYPMGICHRDVNLKNVMYCDDGKYYLIDVNPRFSAGVAFSVISGYDMIINHIRCFVNEEIDKQIPVKQQIIIKKYDEVIF
jgi:hypothetical protein